ncbi:MAG TPA: hypothetical protein VFE33_35850 [Thermoanaerobaculia bacterium]|nr:hypothetical protein [Thermoanaerobaculia bacterium]
MRRNDDLLDRWLKAEEGGSEIDADFAADAALTALFAALPLALAPAPGFADRVLAATSAEPQPSVRAHVLGLLYGFIASPWGRVSVALSLVGAALTLPVFANLLPAALALLRPTFLAPIVAHALVEGSSWVASGLHFCHWFAAFIRTLLTPLQSPAVAAALGACFFVPALALRLLYDLIQRERNWTHANPI